MSKKTEECEHITHKGKTSYDFCPKCGLDFKEEKEYQKNLRQMFKCCGCNKSSKLASFEYVHDFWFEDCPYTPNWNLSENELILVCPKCRVGNRIMSKYAANAFLKVEEFEGEFSKYYCFFGDFSRNDYYLMKDSNPYDNGVRVKVERPYTKWINY